MLTEVHSAPGLPPKLSSQVHQQYNFTPSRQAKPRAQAHLRFAPVTRPLLSLFTTACTHPPLLASLDRGHLFSK